MACRGVDGMPGLAGNCVHYEFVQRTDRRNLFGRIKGLVAKAKEVAAEDLEVRRGKLKAMLDREDRMYEAEFAERVKARIDRDIKERKDRLMQIRGINDAKTKKFIEMKRVQQYMNSCSEVRDAMRRKESLEIKSIQEQQMLEKERAYERERELDKFWMKINKVKLDREDQRQIEENCLKEELNKQTKFLLDKQIEEINERKAAEQKEKDAEIERINNLVETLRLEEFDRKHEPVSPTATEYRAELLAMIEERRQAKQLEIDEAAAEHRQLIAAVQKEEADASAAVVAAKKAHNRALLEFIAYTKRMRQLETDARRMRIERIEDLRRVDVCTKGNRGEEMRRKAQEAAKYYAELRRQICEQYERRRLDELDRRENKMPENRFVKSEKSRSEILAQRRMMRRELDQQIEDLRKYRAEEEKKYQESLLKAMDDPEMCRKLAVKYVSEGIDYLEPHWNWGILLDPCKQYIAKPPDEQQWPADGPTELSAIDDTCKSTCFQPCGCVARPLHASGHVRHFVKPKDADTKTKCKPKFKRLGAERETAYKFELV